MNITAAQRKTAHYTTIHMLSGTCQQLEALAADWFGTMGGAEVVGITADTSDEQLSAIARSINSRSGMRDGAMLWNTRDYLAAIREDLSNLVG